MLRNEWQNKIRTVQLNTKKNLKQYNNKHIYVYMYIYQDYLRKHERINIKQCY